MIHTQVLSIDFFVWRQKCIILLLFIVHYTCVFLERPAKTKIIETVVREEPERRPMSLEQVCT